MRFAAILFAMTCSLVLAMPQRGGPGPRGEGPRQPGMIQHQPNQRMPGQMPNRGIRPPEGPRFGPMHRPEFREPRPMMTHRPPMVIYNAPRLPGYPLYSPYWYPLWYTDTYWNVPVRVERNEIDRNCKKIKTRIEGEEAKGYLCRMPDGDLKFYSEKELIIK